MSTIAEGFMRGQLPADSVIADCQRQMTDWMAAEIEASVTALTTTVQPTEPRAETTEAEDALAEQARVDLERRVKSTQTPYDLVFDRSFPLNLDLHSKLEILAPPYDIDWTTGAIALADRMKGEVQLLTISNSQTVLAGAVGVFLSPQSNLLVRISTPALLRYTWGYLSWSGGAHATSEGGAGILVADTGAQTFVKEVRTRLWTDGWWVWGLDSRVNNDEIALTATPAGQAYVPMVGGRSYLVWVWMWAAAQASGNIISAMGIRGKVPFIVIDPSPLPVIG